MKKLDNVRDLRSEILEVLGLSKTPIQLLDLSKRLRVRADSDEYSHLRDLITDMSEDGSIMRHSRRRYSLPPNTTDGLRGVLTRYHDNATVKTDDLEFPVIHIRRQHMLTALDGDTVLVRPHAIPKDRKIRGEVVAVVERSPHPISGTIEYDGAFYYLIPDEGKYHVDFLISDKNLNGAKPGDKVVAMFVRWEHANASPEASVKEVLGTSGKAAVEFEAVRKEFRLPTSFPDTVTAQAESHSQPPSKAPKGRVDITNELVITIDPVDARDFDDALSLRMLPNGNVELGVHIADVAYYVTEGSALDLEALKRGNSTYLVDGVVPMLPEHLSNNICSLVPNIPRFAYSVFMEFTTNGVRKDYRIEETLIQSKRRYSYEEAQEIIDKGVGDNVELVLQLHKLAKTLYTNRMKDGGIDFETQEIKFILDEQKMPIKAIVKTRTEATSLVEECMLAANRTVAEHLKTLKAIWKTKELPPYVYRIHDQPDKDKLESAVGIIRALGFDVPSGKLTPIQLNAVLGQASNRVEKPVVNTLLLRSMAKAVYAEHNIGHFGLGFTDYAHFTSPIRRYPDLYVHRALKEYAKGQPSRSRWNELKDLAGTVGEQCSLTERAAVEAERASVKCAQTILAREHVGSDHVGYVTGVAQFGVFITLQDLMIEGLLHLRDINDDYYIFDEKKMRLFGRKNRRVFRYGSLVRVRIAKANVEKRMIDLVLSLDQTGLEQTVELVSEKRKKTGAEKVKRRTRES